MKNEIIYTLDDDESFNMILKSVLKKIGFEVRPHLNSSEFLSSLKEERPSMAIIDLNIDQAGEGFQLLKAIRKVIGQELPILVMSRRGDHPDVMRAMEVGATDFLPKPLDDQYLKIKLKRYFPENPVLEGVSLDMTPVSKGDCEGEVFFEMDLKKVSEQGFELVSPHFLRKDSYMKVVSGFVREIFGVDEMMFKVLECSQDLDKKNYKCIVTRELESEDIYALRRWLVKMNQKEVVA